MRPLTSGAPADRAIVAERSREIRDDTDPRRLFGSKEALAQRAREAGVCADHRTLHSLPLSETIVKSLG